MGALFRARKRFFTILDNNNHFDQQPQKLTSTLLSSFHNTDHSFILTMVQKYLIAFLNDQVEKYF